MADQEMRLKEVETQGGEQEHSVSQPAAAAPAPKLRKRRATLDQVFEGLNINYRSRSESPGRIPTLESLKMTISKGWPSVWGTMKEGERLSLTIKADDIYRAYAKDQNPGVLFEKAANWLTTIDTYPSGDFKDSLNHVELQESMCRAIFGSNFIERAGLDLDITIQLCRKVFTGEEIETIEDREPDYEAKLYEMISAKKISETQLSNMIIRGRKEVVQHAQAFNFLIQEFVAKDKMIDENMILKTHEILCTDVPILHHEGAETPSSGYTGRYRNVPVQAGGTMFVIPARIQEAMDRFYQNLASEIQSAKDSKTLDPFSLASKYCLEFVQIHPFQDGNGRTCRMILNAILCKFAGIVVPIGESEEERAEYLNIKKKASAQMEGHSELATFVLKRAETRLRTIKKKLHGKKQSCV